MNKNSRMLIGFILLSFGLVPSAWAKPESHVINTLNSQVFRVEVTHQNNTHGLGSGVVIAEDQLVTNCHVVNNASEIKVVIHGTAHVATSLKADWYHDICIIQVPNLSAPVAKLGNSKDLHYQTPLVTVGFPDTTTNPINSFGEVVGLFPMDGGMVIRATNTFRLGASGGGMFDEAGQLVGVITLKSRGADAQYFFMPVEWVSALLNKPFQSLAIEAFKPFWAMDVNERPYFMKVVQPLVAHDWMSLKAVSTAWVADEPASAESWAHLAMAEFETHEYVQAIVHYKKARLLSSDAMMMKILKNQIEGLATLNHALPNDLLLSLK